MGWSFSDSFDFSNIEKCRNEFISNYYINEHFKFVDDCKNSSGYFQILWDTKKENYVCFYYMLKYSKGEWGYKDLDDSMGPADPCPIKMLKYLEKNDKSKMSINSIEWIKRSRAAIAENKKRQKESSSLKTDSIILLESSLLAGNEKFKECKILGVGRNSFLITPLDNEKLDKEKFNLSKRLLNKVGFSIKPAYYEQSLFD